VAEVGGRLALPPRIKVLEALGSLADGRIRAVGDAEATVISSMGDRSYRVYVDLARGVAYSDDNGTKYRGYVGYPIIAFLMLKGVLPVDRRMAEALKGIPWKTLNERYKRYAIVESIVKEEVAKRGVSSRELDDFVDGVLKRLAQLQLRYQLPPSS